MSRSSPSPAERHESVSGDPSRRELLLGAAALAAGLAGGQPNPSQAAAAEETDRPGRWDHEYTFGHDQLFMDQYHQGLLGILGRISGELELVGELTSRAASVIRSGHSVWTSMNDGHMPHWEQRADRRGSPVIMKDHQNWQQLKKGDMLFTNHCNKDVLAARERGIYVVAVTISYIDNEFRPEGFTDESHSNPDGLKLRDVSNVILHSHTPYTQGLVRAPEIPEFALCPSSQTGVGALHWMLNAEIANKLADPKAPAVARSAEYLRTLTRRIRQIGGHRTRIRETAVKMAHRIRAGGRWFVRSLEHKGLSSEMEHVACGSRIVNWGDWKAKPRQNGMLISAISLAFRAEVDMALKAQVEGAYVIGIGPTTANGVVPDGQLLDVCDVGFDNFSPETGGVIAIKGRDSTICPTSGLTSNCLQQMLCAQWADEMVRRGSVPFFFAGGYQQGGSEYNAAMQIFFERQGF